MEYYHVHLRVTDCVPESEDVYTCSLTYMGSGLADGDGDFLRFTDRIRGVIEFGDVRMLPEASEVRNKLEPGVLEYSIEGERPLFLRGEIRARYRLRRGRLLALHIPYDTGDATFVIDILDRDIRPHDADFTVTDEACVEIPDVETRPILRTPDRDVWFVSATNVPGNSNLVLQWSIPAMESDNSGMGSAEAFLCYAHADSTDYVKTFQNQLEPHLDGHMTVWADTRLRPGEIWRDEIEAALKRASVAVVLVSEAFLKSDFIRDSELPTLLTRAKEDGLQIFWVKANACIVKDEITRFQAALDGPSLEELNLPERRAAISKVCEDVLGALRGDGR